MKLYLICGPPAHGKTYVCKAIKEKFDVSYVEHDINCKRHPEAILEAMQYKKPVITECPFGERALRDQLESYGVEVTPIFVIEELHVAMKRYQNREGKPYPQNHITRTFGITKRAEEWSAPYGTSDDMIQKVSEIIQWEEKKRKRKPAPK